MKLSTIFFGLNVIGTSIAATIDVIPSDSIQDALEKAQPGDTIVLGDGVYDQDFTSIRDGTPEARITITGSKKAIVKGERESRMIQIFHSYHTLDGFVVDGMSGDGKKKEDYTDKLIYVHGQRMPEKLKRNGKEYMSAIDGIVISNMLIKNAGGECIRMRYYITMSVVSGNHVENCGVHDFIFDNMKAVNGETLYIGTSSNQWSDGKNPSSGPDESKYIHVHHNTFESQANEVDVKEGSSEVVIEYNECSTQKDPNSACLDSRTDKVIFRYNQVFNCEGAGVRVGGHEISGHQYGQLNEVYGNEFSNNKAGALKLQTGPTITCENKCSGECKVSGSASSENTDIEGKCSGLMEIDWIDSTAADKPSVSVSEVEQVEQSEVNLTEEDSKDSEDEDSKSTKSVGLTMEAEEESKEESHMSSGGEAPEAPEFELEAEVDEESSECEAVLIRDVKASSEDGDNTAALAVDETALTRWSAKGEGEWIDLTFESESEVNAVEISLYKGDSRTQSFDILVDGSEALKGKKSSGKSLNLQRFPLKESMTGSVLRLVGQGNSENPWNSITELVVCGKSSGSSSDSKPEEHDAKTDSYAGDCDKVSELEIETVESSSDDGNKATNVLDGNLKTRWSAAGPDEQTLELRLKSPSFVSELELAVHNGDSRKAFFDILALTSRGWEDVLVDGESKKGSGLQSYDIGVEDVRAVKVVTYGYDDLETEKHSDWNSFTGVEVYGC